MQFFEKKCRMCTEKREINVYKSILNIGITPLHYQSTIRTLITIIGSKITIDEYLGKNERGIAVSSMNLNINRIWIYLTIEPSFTAIFQWMNPHCFLAT